MKKLLLICFTSIVLLSCQSKSDKVRNFVDMYNRSSSMMVSSMIKSSKATSTGPDEITIEVNTAHQGSDDMEGQLITSSFPELIGQAIKSEKLGQELLDSGVKFKLKIYGADGRVIADEAIDQNKLKGTTQQDLSSIASGNATSSQLNSVLEVFNKNLPMEDKATGTKVMSIKADENNNIVYTTEVPESYKKMLEMDGAEQIIKDEMLRMPQIRQIFSRTEALGVKNLKYLYTDVKGKAIKEITITKEDLK